MHDGARQTWSGWGRYLRTEAVLRQPRDTRELQRTLSEDAAPDRIPRGNGCSYGDAALSAELVSSRWLDELISLDPDRGILRCQAGTTLDTLTRLLLPRGWLPPVLPGTARVTVGGAVAADIHGKNHHLDGCISDHIEELTLLTGEGETITCSATQRPEVFHASCGGMGLTGHITEVALRLRRVPGPMIHQRVLRSRNLSETLTLLARHHEARYSVAWLDSLTGGSAKGRGAVMLGEHVAAPPEPMPDDTRLSIPFSTPSWLLNRYSMALFNTAQYHRLHRQQYRMVHAHRYFFPLDSVANWNRLYGRKGFLQYQFVVPDASAEETIRDVLRRTRRLGVGSFLTVLKRTGPANNNPLSFPLSGYTLALDFKYHPDLLPVLDTLDEVILEAGGRVYLAKDARLSQQAFQRMYPRWEEFATVRRALGAHHHFHSLLSRRLGL